MRTRPHFVGTIIVNLLKSTCRLEWEVTFKFIVVSLLVDCVFEVGVTLRFIILREVLHQDLQLVAPSSSGGFLFDKVLNVRLRRVEALLDGGGPLGVVFLAIHEGAFKKFVVGRTFKDLDLGFSVTQAWFASLVKNDLFFSLVVRHVSLGS